jgi:hypothetical protein
VPISSLTWFSWTAATLSFPFLPLSIPSTHSYLCDTTQSTPTLRISKLLTSIESRYLGAIQI